MNKLLVTIGLNYLKFRLCVFKKWQITGNIQIKWDKKISTLYVIWRLNTAQQTNKQKNAWTKTMTIHYLAPYISISVSLCIYQYINYEYKLHWTHSIKFKPTPLVFCQLLIAIAASVRMFFHFYSSRLVTAQCPSFLISIVSLVSLNEPRCIPRAENLRDCL